MEGDSAERSRATRTAGISIHALRVEGDDISWYFEYVLAISIHALRVEGDALRLGFAQPSLISIHALRVEGDL